jgi:uncharacterized membrane protein YtjA (UPF0391 family)
MPTVLLYSSIILLVALITGVLGLASVPAAEANIAKVLFLGYLLLVPIFVFRDRRNASLAAVKPLATAA